MPDERDSSGPAVRQAPFPFPARRRYDRASFHVSASNKAALDLVDRWPHWPSHMAAIFSDPGAGKTHLLRIWAERAGAAIFDGRQFGPDDVVACAEGFSAAVDDADVAAARDDGAKALFHLLNRAQQEGGYVLLSGSTAPSSWRTGLPDLRTRLAAATSAAIELPDDELMAAALTKSFADHQLTPPPALIAFIVARLERNVSAAEALVDAMDQATIGTGKMLSAELAGRLIEELRRD